MQSTTLLNGLQRENSAKDALVHQAKTEIEKLKKELREKDSTISTMSTKVRRNWTTTLLMLIDTRLLYTYRQHSDSMERGYMFSKAFLSFVVAFTPHLLNKSTFLGARRASGVI